MKKLIVMVVAAVATIGSASAMSPKEAFSALSDIQNVVVTAPDYNLPVDADIARVGQIAAAYNLSKEQMNETSTAAYTILNQVPLTYMVNGGNNGEVAAFIYATPNDAGDNDVLIAVMSELKGSVVFISGTADDATVSAIQAAPLNIEGNYLNLQAQMPNGDDFNITLSKAR